MFEVSQTSFVFRGRGGRRPGAGRKRRPENAGLLPHVARPALKRHTPVLVTMRAVRAAPPMRTQSVAVAVLRELARSSTKGFRLLHYSIQGDHLHLLAEADDGHAFSRGMQRLASRVALAVNAIGRRRGRLWRERYHRRDLTSPRQFRNSLVYVVFNARKHARDEEERAHRMTVLDGFSSAIWTDDWASPEIVTLVRSARAGPSPLAPAASWIARTGWKKHGLLRPTEMPAVSPR